MSKTATRPPARKGKPARTPANKSGGAARRKARPAAPGPDAKARLLDKRASAHALYALLAENGAEILWECLVDRINDTIGRLGSVDDPAPYDANHAMRLRALIDAVFALETSGRPLELERFDYEAEAKRLNAAAG